jgi:hypothetical protein
MYVSYAVGVAIMIAIIGFFLIFPDEFSFLKTFITLVVVIVAGAPFINAVSKILWANLFFKYDPKK